MDARQRSFQELQQIKQMMERSSKFISLSGLSGISAGICALAGAWFASQKIHCWQYGDCKFGDLIKDTDRTIQNQVLLIAVLTFVAAFSTSFLFAYLRSKKMGDAYLGYNYHQAAMESCHSFISRRILFNKKYAAGSV